MRLTSLTISLDGVVCHGLRSFEPTICFRLLERGIFPSSSVSIPRLRRQVTPAQPVPFPLSVFRTRRIPQPSWMRFFPKLVTKKQCEHLFYILVSSGRITRRFGYKIVQLGTFSGTKIKNRGVISLQLLGRFEVYVVVIRKGVALSRSSDEHKAERNCTDCCFGRSSTFLHFVS